MHRIDERQTKHMVSHLFLQGAIGFHLLRAQVLLPNPLLRGKAGGWVFIVGWPLLGQHLTPEQLPQSGGSDKDSANRLWESAQPIPKFPRGAHRERAGCWHITLTCLEADRLSRLFLIWTKEF